MAKVSQIYQKKHEAKGLHAWGVTSTKMTYPNPQAATYSISACILRPERPKGAKAEVKWPEGPPDRNRVLDFQ